MTDHMKRMAEAAARAAAATYRPDYRWESIGIGEREIWLRESTAALTAILAELEAMGVPVKVLIEGTWQAVPKICTKDIAVALEKTEMGDLSDRLEVEWGPVWSAALAAAPKLGE